MPEYKTKAIFLRKSKKGNHLFAFFVDGSSQVMPVEDVMDLIDDKVNYVKVDLLEKKDE
jgi:hypothetical protein